MDFNLTYDIIMTVQYQPSGLHHKSSFNILQQIQQYGTVTIQYLENISTIWITLHFEHTQYLNCILLVLLLPCILNISTIHVFPLRYLECTEFTTISVCTCK